MNKTIYRALELVQSGDTRTLTSFVPDILHRKLSGVADIVIEKRHESILPEVFLLASTASFMKASNLIGENKNEKQCKDILKTTARIGQYNFSFPIWRFLSQSFNGASLIERYGFDRLERSTDVRDETLPKSNPDRDLLGIGFVYSDDQVYIEYRRSYILISSLEPNHQTSLLIRNSSYFYGRDRLEFPAYVSFNKFDAQELSNLNEDSISARDNFIPWHEFLGQKIDGDSLRKIKNLLDGIDQSGLNINEWLLGKAKDGDGANQLKDALSYFYETLCTKGMKIHLCGVEQNRPPWYPHSSIELTDSLLQNFNIRKVSRDLGIGGRYRFALLSGANGDFPIKPEVL